MNPTRSFATVATAMVLAAPMLLAEDDTHGCLSTYTGPIVTAEGTHTLTGNSRYIYPPSTGDVAPNTRFDFREAFFKKDLNAAVTDFINDRETVCIAGGTILGTYSRTITWGESHSDGSGLAIHGPNTTVDGVRIDNNAQDGVYVSRTVAKDFVIKNNWISYNRDDCVENDHNHGGVVEDNLFDGCYTFFSLQDECGDNCAYRELVKIHGNLIHMQNMPYPYVHPDRRDTDHPAMGWGAFFKQATSDNDPSIDFVDNVIYMEPNQYNYFHGQEFKVREFSKCEGNILIWTGTGDWPDATWENLPDGCLEAVYRGQEGLDVWNTIKKNWIDCHPDVGRVDGDPQSNGSACDENAYGGGGTPTKILPDVTGLVPGQRPGKDLTTRWTEARDFDVFALDGRRVGTASALLSGGRRLPAGAYVVRPCGEAGGPEWQILVWGESQR